MQFDILGPLQVLDAGRPLALGRPKQRAVLAILLLDAGRVVSLDRLVDELWGQEAPAQALASVQAYVSHLRRLLEPRRTSGTPAKVLVNQAPGYRIVVPDEDLDAARFEALAQQGHDLLQTGQIAEASRTLADALRLWRGPVLADFADAPFVQAERARLGDLRLTALEDRLSADLRLGRHAMIVAELEQLAAEHPFREQLQGLRMAALYRCGRQVEALQTYQQFRTHLRDELGLDPGQALRDLERDILCQARQLDWAPPSTPFGEPPGEPPGGVRSVRPGDAVSAVADGRLVGRRAELQVIDEALAGASAGRGRVILVSGEPGIGKTELAEEATRRARDTGVTVAWGRNDQDTGAPAFWPWTQMLRQLLSAGTPASDAAELGGNAAELALILPELDDGLRRVAPVVDPEAARFRLCQAATSALTQLSAGRRLLLVLDDLQWADPASQRLLKHVAVAVGEAPIVVLVTYRSRTVDGGEGLADTLAALARTATIDRLELGGLDRAGVAGVMAARFGVVPEDELARLIVERTGGNPFFVLEVLRLLGTHGWPGRTIGDAASLIGEQVPTGVRDVLRRRLSRLPEQTRTVLLIAAVIGQEFDLELIRAVTGVDDDDALAAVELTVSVGLVVEHESEVGRFRFAHALIREAVYGEISRARRARLHARVGQAMLDHPRESPEHVLQVAHHWWLAAPVVGAEQAVPHVIRAAEMCFDSLAHEEAERQLRRGLGLLADTPASAGRSTAELAIRLRLGSLLVQLRGTATQEAWACFARARELAEELGDRPALLAAHRSLYEVAFARADHRTAGHLAEAMLNTAQRSDDRAALVVSHLLLGRTLWSQGRLSAARHHLERGLQASGTDQSQEFLPPRVVLQLQLAAVLAPLGEPEAANRLLAAAVEEAQGGSPFAHAIATAGAALVAALARDQPAARAWAVETLDLAERWRMVTPGGYAAVVLSWVDALNGSPARAITEMRRHLDQIETGGAQHLLAWGLGLLAEAHLHDGRPSEALRLLDDALVRVDQTGERLYESELHRLRALSLLELDPPRRDEARHALGRAVGVAREQGSSVLQQRASDAGAAAGLGAQSGSASHPEPRP